MQTLGFTCSLFLGFFLINSYSAAQVWAFPKDERYPFRRFYAKPDPSNSPPEKMLSTRIDVDLISIHQNEVDATQALRPTGTTLLQGQAHDHSIYLAKNEKLRLALHAREGEVTSGIGLSIPDRSGVNQIHSAIRMHSVVGTAAEQNYDLKKMVGYCFGRAAFVHLELSRKGVPQSDLIKLFAFGKLVHSGSIWNFHVATAVLGSEVPGGPRKWWVIDSLFDQPMGVDEWMKRVSQFSVLKKNSDVRFYATDARKFQPTSGEYATNDLLNPIYGGYFENLYRSMETANGQSEPKRR